MMSSKHNSVFVVIPNWNGADMIRNCLDSLRRQTKKHTVVVVDNGSVDDSVAIIEKEYPEAKLLKLPFNTGFDGGVNRGIEYAIEHKATMVALFNNDAFAKDDWLEQLSKSLDRNPNAGIVTGKFMRSDKVHIDSTGEFYTIWGMAFPRGRNQKDKGQYEAEEPVPAATGGATIYRTELFKQIGLFDEYFFAYLEDVDISLRARLAGWDILYMPEAVAYHHVSYTSSKLKHFSRYHYVKNFYMTYAKNMPWQLYWKYLPFFILQATRLFIGSLIKGRGWTYIQGTARAFLNTPHVITERHRIQRTKKISASELDEILYKHRPPKIPAI